MNFSKVRAWWYKLPEKYCSWFCSMSHPMVIKNQSEPHLSHHQVSPVPVWKPVWIYHNHEYGREPDPSCTKLLCGQDIDSAIWYNGQWSSHSLVTLASTYMLKLYIESHDKVQIHRLMFTFFVWVLKKLRMLISAVCLKLITLRAFRLLPSSMYSDCPVRRTSKLKPTFNEAEVRFGVN